MAGILTHEQKQLAFRLRARGWRLVDIAREVGCTAPMVGLMVREGRFTTGVPDEWAPRVGCLGSAHQRARERARRPKPCKLRAGPLRDEVARRLLELWSPDEIARRLPLDFPDDPEMRVSHETIYQSLFVQGRGELRRELARMLARGATLPQDARHR